MSRSHVSFILSLYLCASLQAEPSQQSVDVLVAETLAKNPEIAFYEAEIAAVKAGRAVAGLPSNPEISLDLGRKRVSSSNSASEGLAYSVSLVQPVEWPGRLGLRKAIANRDIQLAELGLESFKFHLASRVRVLAYMLAAQQEVSRAASEVAGRYNDLRDVMVQREPAGIAPQLEVTTIEAAAIVAESRAAKADIEVQKAMLELNQLLGARADTALIIARQTFSLADLPTSEALLTKAANNNYELRVRRSELEQQGFKVALAQNERYPTFTVGPYASQERAVEKETVVGLSLSVPLPIWDSGKANVTAAQSRQIQAQATLNAAQREMEKQIMEAVLLFRSHQKRLNLWKGGGIGRFGEAAALADRHYRLGAVPITTYVELQDKYLEAVEAINETQAQALEAALSLEEITGSPASLVKSSQPKSK